jgi:hypothetical protein
LISLGPGNRMIRVPVPSPQPATSEQETWQPGQSGNPAGRPIGALARISEQLLADLATVWETHSASVLERLAITDPGKLAQIAYGLLPRQSASSSGLPETSTPPIGKSFAA